MSQAIYWQRGESLDYVNTTNTVIEANTIISISGRVGVAGTSINPGEKGSLHVTGVYEIAKTEDKEIIQGTDVYFDGEGITSAADNGQSDGKVTWKAWLRSRNARGSAWKSWRGGTERSGGM